MSEELHFRINSHGPIAVYVQIENQVQFAIASGRVRPGQTLPSVRDLSLMLNVNPNTVTKAFRDLELMGLVTTTRGVGINVADNARGPCKKLVAAMVRKHLRDAVGECAASGLTDAQIKKLVAETLASGYRPYAE